MRRTHTHNTRYSGPGTASGAYSGTTVQRTPSSAYIETIPAPTQVLDILEYREIPKQSTGTDFVEYREKKTEKYRNCFRATVYFIKYQPFFFRRRYPTLGTGSSTILNCKELYDTRTALYYSVNKITLTLVYSRSVQCVPVTLCHGAISAVQHYFIVGETLLAARCKPK